MSFFDAIITQGARAVGTLFGGPSGGQAAGALATQLTGGGGQNIAKSLSKQVGFTVAQSDAATVRARLASGLDPRTGQATTNRVALANPGAGLARVGGVRGITQSLFSKLGGGFGAPQSFVADPDIEAIINRPATGTQPPIALPPPVPLPTVSEAILRTVAKPPTPVPIRQPVPPGGGKVSLIAAGGMSSMGAIARMGARGLVRTSTGRISRIMLPSGQTFSRKNAASLIRRVGFEAAAVALGISVVEAAELLLTDSQTRRRGRGITAAQVRNARSTTRRVACLARDLGIKAAPVRRRKTCR